MAYTATQAVHGSTVFGNQRVWQGLVTADAASGVVSFGLAVIDHATWAPQSASTAGIRVRINALASGTASVGDIGLSGAVSGDVLYFTVFGR